MTGTGTYLGTYRQCCGSEQLVRLRIRLIGSMKIDIFQIVNFSFFLKLFIQNLFVKIQIDLFYSEFLFFCTEYFGYMLKIVKKILVVT